MYFVFMCIGFKDVLNIDYKLSVYELIKQYIFGLNMRKIIIFYCKLGEIVLFLNKLGCFKLCFSNLEIYKLFVSKYNNYILIYQILVRIQCLNLGCLNLVYFFLC